MNKLILKQVLKLNERTPIFYRETDGFLVFAPNERSGFFTSAHLRTIADYLDEQNKEWAEQLEKALSSAAGKERD